MSNDARRKGGILVIDDDPELREALACVLEHEGHQVMQAPDGPSAVRMTRELDPDLLVLDLAMPGMDGAMVLGALRRELSEVPPALLLTAGGDPQARALELGATVGLEKPFNVPELLDAVERHRRRTEGERS